MIHNMYKALLIAAILNREKITQDQIGTENIILV